MTDAELHKHQFLSPMLSRWRVPGGWLYRVGDASATFVPDPLASEQEDATPRKKGKTP